jgi:predicted 3-demethylubiquinone-9 3-methyltransferase (glyoxalase superfamily)
MPKITPWLWFADEAEEAAGFYVSILPDSRIDRVVRYPADCPGGPAGSVAVVEFTLAGQRVAALNGGSRQEFGHAVSLAFECEEQAELDRVWDGLSAGGTKEQCGWLKKRYGVSWQIVPGRLGTMMNDPDRTRAARVMRAMMDMVKLDIAALERAYEGGPALTDLPG